jgi:hypothetical protein
LIIFIFELCIRVTEAAMRSATLSQYLAIIKTLGNAGPLKADELFPSVLMERDIIGRALLFLAEQELVKAVPEVGGESSGFVATSKGLRVLDFFGSNPRISSGKNSNALR